MQYILKEKKDFKACVKYLKKEDILFQYYDIKDYYIINVFDNTLCSKIENEEEAFLNTKDISIENGYLVTKRYKEKTIIDVKGIKIGGEEPVVISGPCSVESEKIVRNIAIGIKKAGADILRGGAFKPRTSPYEFQGLGRKGIDILNKIGKELDIPVVTEIMDIRELDYMIDKVDILQVGARNMYNYSLLKELGKVDKPILLKRGLSATIKEFLLSAEYIMLGGNEKIILCERGIRTYEDCMRNTMDIAAISLLKNMTHLPIIADPSHATGKRELIVPLSKASIAAGANGLIIESHLNPESAWSDGKQTIDISSLRKVIRCSE
ncbi:MAG: 3-deoxy-7-phosphoheptulonate synthase [Peptostreptococcus sp.]|uniref:3-deoxy-7-phosphoheptulonate synthase n=1 Tax=Peptostreptococcus sp. TaxID=1262 RepID=UPI000763D3F0|nr:3-deoxy-7-phosphoheptulonate synthase [Peptostreptococcus sp.]KXA00229.1 3-deoxy-7-phosphoheptulonate synthase [Anaerococcus hydrogenalis]MDU5350740.1 3-deoxy-7-phosphoheptulonate synthase [Peptostreptococcus sp.]MDU5890360.1 3-deoxy-7-phosphoheptulonate synthase [Peptostreptococcus sp.]